MPEGESDRTKGYRLARVMLLLARYLCLDKDSNLKISERTLYILIILVLMSVLLDKIGFNTVLKAVSFVSG